MAGGPGWPAAWCACRSPSLPYSRAMPAAAPIFAWPRLRFTLIVSVVIGFLIGLHSKSTMSFDLTRAVFVGLAVLAVFGFFEQFPRRMPRWLPRTVLRLIAIAIIIPISTGIIIALTGGATEHDYGLLMGTALLIAPWIAIGT